MTMTAPLRKLALTAHIAFSAGWIGAIAAFLPPAVIGLTSGDDRIVRGAYMSMESIGWYALVPLAFASLLAGLVSSRWALHEVCSATTGCWRSSC